MNILAFNQNLRGCNSISLMCEKYLQICKWIGICKHVDKSVYVCIDLEICKQHIYSARSSSVCEVQTVPQQLCSKFTFIVFKIYHTAVDSRYQPILDVSGRQWYWALNLNKLCDNRCGVESQDLMFSVGNIWSRNIIDWFGEKKVTLN